MNIITFLTSFLLSGEQCPTRVVVAAGKIHLKKDGNKTVINLFFWLKIGQCLNTLTDDNKDLLIEFQNHPQYVESLFNIIKNENENTLVQVLACGKCEIETRKEYSSCSHHIIFSDSDECT